MNVHEYQAKELLREFGVAVPPGQVASTPAEAEAAARGLEAGVVVVKAQVHAGGRGKGGGIVLAKSAQEAKQRADEVLGMNLVTPQTGAAGKLVRKVYVEAGSEIEHEYYLGIVLDRAEEKLAIIASTEGGVEIEEVAAKTPEKIITVHLHADGNLPGYAARRIGFGLGFDADKVKQLGVFLATASSTSTTTPCTGTPTWRPCAIPTRRTRGSARPTRSTWPTWASMGTSAAW